MGFFERILKNDRVWRLDYVFWILMIMSFFLAIDFLIIIIDADSYMLLWSIALLITIYFIVNLSIKRFHDLDESWWWFLSLFVPLANICFFLILLFKKWTPWANDFWPSPKDLRKLNNDFTKWKISKEELEEKTREEFEKSEDLRNNLRILKEAFKIDLISKEKYEKEIKKLFEKGLISEEKYEKEKQKILDF